jgi:hypothetical protein
MSIPLVQNNEKDSINTSIIAIKRNIERINMLLGLVDSGSPDLSGLATKQELEDAITQVETDLAPVDEVTVGNMQSVTSNAVYNKIKYTYDTNFLVTSGNSATEVSVATRFPINNFNYLIFVIRWGNDPYIYDTRILPTDVFATVNRQIFVQNVDGARARFRYVDNTHIKCQMENAVHNPYYEVIGIL